MRKRAPDTTVPALPASPDDSGLWSSDRGRSSSNALYVEEIPNESPPIAGSQLKLLSEPIDQQDLIVNRVSKGPRDTLRFPDER